MNGPSPAHVWPSNIIEISRVFFIAKLKVVYRPGGHYYCFGSTCIPPLPPLAYYPHKIFPIMSMTSKLDFSRCYFTHPIPLRLAPSQKLHQEHVSTETTRLIGNSLLLFDKIHSIRQKGMDENRRTDRRRRRRDRGIEEIREEKWQSECIYS